MTLYRYRAIDAEGLRHEGELQIASERELENRLSSDGLMLLEAKTDAPATTRSVRSSTRVKAKAVQEFTLNLATMLSAGVALVQSLELVGAEVGEPRLQSVIDNIVASLHEGSSFSEALAKFPRVFPPIYINLVAAGEVSGKLEETLEELARYMEWQAEIKGSVKQATIYPAVIMSAVLGLCTLLITFVIPTFTQIFVKVGMPLPLPTRILITICDIATNYWYAFVGAAVGAVLSVVITRRFDGGRLFLDRSKLRIPIFGKVLAKIALARFAQNLSVLFNAGVPVTMSLDICQRLVGNEYYAGALRETERLVTRGQGIAESLKSTGVMPQMVINMIVVGEESGKLGYTLAKVKEYYDREVKASIKKAFSLLEPAIIAGMGVIVGFMAITVLYTMFKMVSYIGKS